MTLRERMRDWTRVGVVAAAVGAGWARQAIRRLSRRPRVGAPRILLVRPDHLGDVLLTTPAIAALRAALPDAHLIALVGPWGAEALSNNPHLDEIHLTRFPGMVRTLSPSPAPWAPYTQLIREAQRLARWRIDAAIVFRADYWWGAAMLALAGIPIRVGYDRAPADRALSHRDNWPAEPEHAAQSALRLAASAASALGASSAAEPPWTPATNPLIFALDEDARAWANAWLERAGLSSGARPLLVHPGAGAAVKLWTVDAWARVVERLASEFGVPVIVAGTRAEANLVNVITQAARSPYPVAAFDMDVPLTRYAALLAAVRMVLGVDSGALHLATAVGTPTVRLFGPTDPAVFGPWGPAERHLVVRGAALPCMPCGRLDYRTSELPAHPCVRLIRPDVVVDAALSVLRQEHREERLEQVNLRRDACEDAPPGGVPRASAALAAERDR